MRFKAAVFDLDGTLLNTLDDLADSVNEALASAGLAAHPTEAFKTFIGNGAYNLIKRTVEESLGREAEEDFVKSVFAEYREIYAARQFDKTRPYDGIPEMLATLHAAGINMSVLSNKPQANTVAVAEHYFDRALFTAVLGQREGCPIKPDPAAALEISGLTGISPSDTIYIGDSGVDMKTARAAGMHPLGVLWGFRSREELVRDGALTLAETPADILKAIYSAK